MVNPVRNFVLGNTMNISNGVNPSKILLWIIQ